MKVGDLIQVNHDAVYPGIVGHIIGETPLGFSCLLNYGPTHKQEAFYKKHEIHPFNATERVSGFEYIALIDNLSRRVGLSHERCRRICADLSDSDLVRLGELVKHPSRNVEIDDLIGMRAFSI